MRFNVLSWFLAVAFLAPVAVLASPSGQGSERPAARRQRQAQNPIDRWNQMSPEERERELAKLPPERARLIRNRIRYYNQLPQPERKALRERYEHFTHLSPEKQAVVRQRLREFRQLPQARRPLVRQAVEQLRSLPESERLARLENEEFRSRFSPDELQIVRDITENFPGFEAESAK